MKIVSIVSPVGMRKWQQVHCNCVDAHVVTEPTLRSDGFRMRYAQISCCLVKGP